MPVNTDIYSHWPHPDEEHHHLLRSSALSPLALCPWQRHPPPFRPQLIHSANRLFRDPFLCFFFWKGKRKERSRLTEAADPHGAVSMCSELSLWNRIPPYRWQVEKQGARSWKHTSPPVLWLMFPAFTSIQYAIVAQRATIIIHPFSQPAFQRPNDR